MTINSLTDQQKVVIAALLHDIGKFRQRTDLEKLDEKFLQNYCPDKNTHFGYQHSGYTAKFIQEHIDQKEKTVDETLIDELIGNIAAKHHLHPESIDDEYKFFYAIIKKADMLASGADRDPVELYIKQDKEQTHHQTARLESIFSQVSLDLKNKPAIDYVYPLESLNPELSVVPRFDLEQTKKNSEKEYSKLWELFLKDWKQLGFTNNENIFQSILSILEKYTSTMPASAFKTAPRVSLFDHLKITAAFADALFLFHTSNANYTDVLDAKEIYKTTPRFRLIQGDFSGIQSFIFSRMGTSNKFAAKILRGKSFFVSLYSELIANLICEKFGISPAAIVLNAGGKFTILAPNFNDSEERIQKIIEQTNAHFKKLTFGQTRINIASVPACDDDFKMGDSISTKLKNLALELEKVKLRPIINTPVFKDYINTVSNKDGLCDICGIHPKTVKIHEEMTCEYCEKFSKLGQQLLVSEFIHIQKKGADHPIWGQWHIEFLSKDSSQVIDARKTELLFLLKEDALDAALTNLKFFPAIRRYAGYVPELTQKLLEKQENKIRYASISTEKFDPDKELSDKEAIPKTFYHLACDAQIEEAGEFRGKSYLGVMKADVDNLGQIFIRGFNDSENKKSKTSLSLIASLSRSLDYFFTAWLIHHIKTNNYNIYTVFCGGDDLFLIGAYTDIIKLSGEINAHLNEYTGHHPDFHLSMGVILTKPMIPVYQMAEEAEEELKKAKNIDADKHAFSMFGHPLKWNDTDTSASSFTSVMQFYEQLKEKERHLSEGFIYNLLQFNQMKEDSAKHPENTRWRALFSYQVYRHFEKKEDNSIQDTILGWAEQIDRHNGNLVIPISRFLYENRK